MQILEEPPHDPAKWNVLQPTDDPDWLEKSDAGVAWDKAFLHLHYAKSLDEAHPEVATMLSNLSLTTDQISEMTHALVIDGKEPQAYAEEWVAAHEDEVLGWMTQ